MVSRSSIKIRFTSQARSIAMTAALLCVAMIATARATIPQYQIYDIGVIDAGDTASQGKGVSHGGIAVGQSLRTDGSQAFTWTLNGGLVPLPNLAGRSFAVSNSANDKGIVVGTGATTFFGTDRLPVIWQNGVVSQLPLPPGETLGDANSVNASTVAVGSVDAGSLQRGVIYSAGSATIITQTPRTAVTFSQPSASTMRGVSWGRVSIRRMLRVTSGSSMILVRARPSRWARCRG